MRATALLLAVLYTLSPVACVFAEEPTVKFTLHPDQILCESFVGFGAHVNGWIYSKPNFNTPEGGINERNVQELERKWIDLAPQHVRIFVEIPGIETYSEDPAVRESVARTITLMQRAGATVNCTLWHGPYPDLEAAGQSMADLMADYIRNRKLTAVKYVTLQNEPNSTTMTMERYNTLYRAFDAAMRRNGLRDRIKIVGGDLLAMQQKEWFENLATNLADVCDGYSVHMYSEYWNETRLLWRVGAIADLAASLPKDRQRPLYLTEFGFRGHRTGDEEPGHDEQGRIVTDTPLYGLLLGWRIVDTLNHGFCAMLVWDGYEAMYDKAPMAYSLIAGVKDNWRLRPHYHLMRMFTHTAKPGWKTIRVEGGNDQTLAAVMHGPDGAWTIYCVNRTAQPLAVSHRNVPASTAFHVLTWNAIGDGAVKPSPEVKSTGDGSLELSLPPHSVIAATTLTLDWK